MNGAKGFRKALSAGGLRRFAARLRADTAGNVIAISAIAVLMLLAAVGGAVDISRAYVTKTNLQAACDSGVLAGRRALSKTGDYGAAEKATARKMFDFNLRQEETDASGIVFESQADDTGSVTGKASATMPLTIMQIFDATDVYLGVECSAELQMASADVMFVLDVTGSMAGTKIQGLRDAVREFHATVANAVIDKDKTVIRYGFVPYSQTVNAKGLLASGAMDPAWFTDQTLYQSRVAVFETPYDVYTEKAPVTGPTETETYGSAISSSNCTKYGSNTYPTSSGKNPVAAGGPAPTPKTSTAYSYKSWTETGKSGSTKIGTCVRNKVVTTTNYDTQVVYKFTRWRYKATTVDTKGLAKDGTLKTIRSLNENYFVPVKGEYDMRALVTVYNSGGLPTIYLPAPSNTAWNGCLEERKTVIDYAMNPIPDGARDLDINSAPDDDDDDTKWKPLWGVMEYNRGTKLPLDGPSYPLSGATERSSTGEACPATMRQFEEVDTTSTSVPSWLDTYLNGLVATGSTYHDIGMIWGARLSSTKGIFSENVLEGDRNSVSRHIIFMTDGVMEPGSGSYNAYGVEDIDGRIAPAGSGSGANSNLSKYHTNRFLAACRRAKEEGYTIWAISFGTAITDAMKTCSSGNRAYFASNTTELKNAFRYIAGQVADLRINK